MAASEPTAVPRKMPAQASTTTSVFARLRVPCRIGFSTSAKVTHESTNAPTISSSFTGTESAWPT